jgi:hypothetical protein
MRDMLAEILATVSRQLAEPGDSMHADTGVLVDIATLCEIALAGPAVPGAPASSTATAVDQVRTLIARHEWERIPGVGFRCPICLASRARQHRAGCWIRHARILLSI